MRVLDKPLAFVDIETSGSHFRNGRIIEIGIVRVEGTSVRRYNTLIDPKQPLASFITSLTGIKSSDLQGAPSFEDVADDIAEYLDGAIFVAHNARFDYGFVAHEFRSLGIPYRPKTLCTVRLSRTLYPSYRGHSLDKLIQRFNFEPEDRHRALADASVLWDFVQRAISEFGPGFVDEAMAKILYRQALPKGLKPEVIDKLPNTAGVYIFEDSDGEPLYVGKSVDIRTRVLSHFTNDIEAVKEMRLAQLVKNVSFITTAGELGALLLESRMIKELQPMYNRALRRIEYVVGLAATQDKQGYTRVEAMRLAQNQIPDLDARILGIFRSVKTAKEKLASMAKANNLCNKLLGLEKGSGPCFGYHLRTCAGACVGEEAAGDYNHRLNCAFEGQGVDEWPYPGPVLINEEGSDASATHVVDRWRLVGTITSDENNLARMDKNEEGFDLDAYKVLRRYIMDKKNVRRIKPIPMESLDGLVA